MLAALLRTRAFRVLLLIDAVTAIVCAFLPLANHLGYEFALILGIANALFAPAVGVAAVDRARRDASGASPMRAAATAGLAAAAALVVPCAIMLVNGLREPMCDVASGLAWIAVLPVPTAWLSTNVGALARAWIARPLVAVLVAVSAELSIALANTLRLYTGPTYSLFDHFGGYFSGALYDVRVNMGTAPLTFRLTTVLWGVAACLAVGAITGLTRRKRLGAASVLLASALAVTTVVWGDALGWWTTHSSLRRALGGERRFDNVVLYYPREWPAKRVEELVRDITYDVAQVDSALGWKRRELVRVWMYRSVTEKARLVGAELTSFAKPWHYEIHIHPAGYPHVPLRHELVHAITGEIGRGPFHVPGGLIPNSALIEGVAEAYDLDDEGQTLEQRAKSLRDMGLAPDLRKILSLTGFVSEAASRAYAYSGAFVRFLQRRSGNAAVHTLYATGQLKSIGDPDSLIAEFERSLDTVHVTADTKAYAARRFSQPSMFKRPCARETDDMIQRAYDLSYQGEYDEALEQWDRVCELQPDDAFLLYRQLGFAIGLQGLDSARVLGIARRLWAHPMIDDGLAASSRVDIGDYYWRRGNVDAAKRLFAEADTFPAAAAVHRSILVRRLALADSALGAALRPLFVETRPQVAMVLHMNDATVANPRNATLAYMLARQLVPSTDRERAVALLERALTLGLDDTEMTIEALRLLARTHAELQRCDDAEAARTRLKAAGGSRADDAVAGDWVGRCRFAVARGWAPIAP
jgi:hypothetical protein